MLRDYLAGLMCVGVLSLGTFPSTAVAQDIRLVTAASEQDLVAVRTLINAGADVNATRADGATALLWASHWDDLDMIRLLLDAGANVNAVDDHGVSALERAAENASLPMVKTLLEAGANAEVSQLSGLTPLMTAARTGNLDVVRTLIAHGADVNATTGETGSSALMWAVSAPHAEIASLLIAEGAAPALSTTKGFTPLMFAARNGDIEMAETLIAAGVDVNATSADGTHVLPFAIVSGQHQLALFLLGEGADPNGTMGGVPALHAAAGGVGSWLGDWYRRHGRGAYGGFGGGFRMAGNRLPLVQALLERGADPNGRITTSAMLMSYIGYPKKGAFEPFAPGTGDLRGATPLWIAAYDMNGAFSQQFNVMPSVSTSTTEVMQALLDAGADLSLTTDDVTTPLMAAAGLGHATYTPREPRGVRSPSAEAAVAFLVEAGADVNAVNEADYTALHGAAFRGLNEVLEYLVAQGATIDARDFRGRTAYRMAEGSKQSFQFQTWPETAELLDRLGANTRLGIPGTVQERLRDILVVEGQD